MKRLPKGLALALFAGGILTACQAREPVGERTGDEVATTAARIDPEAEEQAIRDLDRRWLEAIRAKDADAIAGLFASDGVGLYDGKRYEGPDAIREDQKETFAKYPNARFTFEPKTIVVSDGGDLAYDIGTYEGSYEENGRKIESRGHYLTVWRKIGDEWKVVADITSEEEADEEAAG